MATGDGRRNGRRGRQVGGWQPIDPAEDDHEPPPAVTTGAVSVEAYVAASLGPPRWLERLQDIESEELRVLGALRRAWVRVAEAVDADADAFAAAWRQQAQKVDRSALNLLIAQHNEYFPIERTLPYDARTGDYRAPWGIAWRRHPRDLAWVMRQFPTDLARARAEAAHVTRSAPSEPRVALRHPRQPQRAHSVFPAQARTFRRTGHAGYPPRPGDTTREDGRWLTTSTTTTEASPSISRRSSAVEER